MKSQVEHQQRVGFLFPHPLSYSLGSTYRVLTLATGLKKLGAEPSIITPFEKTRTANGIKVINVPSIFSKLGLNEMSYRLARKFSSSKSLSKFLIRNMRRTLGVNKGILNILQKYKLDILQIEQEPTAVSMLPILSELPVPIVLDFHGIWAEELVDNKVIARNSYEYSLLQNKVGEAVTNVDATLVMSESMKHYIVKNYGCPSSKVHVIELSTQPRLRKVPKRSDPPKIIYAGVMAREKHSEIFLESIPYVVKKHPSTQFFMTNKGDLIEEAHMITKTSGARAKFFWFSTQEQLFRLMTTCNAGILTLPDNISYRLSPAAKFFDYLTAGLPVVSNNIGGWTSIIEEEQTGVLTGDDPVEFSKGILKLIDNPSVAQEYGQRGLDLVRERYSADRICRKLIDVYSTLLR
jgi:glycosyltransferase involved in cell wall biosynthesis